MQGWKIKRNSSQKIFLIVFIAATLITMLSVSPSDAFAVSHELQIGDENGTCEAIGGTWNSGTSTCTLSTSLTLNSGDSLQVDAGVNLVLFAPIFNSGTINNAGTIWNYANIENSSTVTNNSGGTINNVTGNLDNYSGATINNAGTINQNFSGGETNNYSGGTIKNAGTINNNSVIFNYGSIYNSGTIDNSGIINNSGNILNQCSGTINNSGSISGNLVINTCDPTSTTVKPNPSSTAIVGTSKIFAGTVTDTSLNSTTPTGTISWSDSGAGGTFKVGGILTNTCKLSSVSSNSSSCKATYKPSPSTNGGNVITITSTYSGDATHNGSSGQSTLTVLRATSTVISPVNAIAGIGGKVVYIATVNDTSSGTPSAPTGAISWSVQLPGGSFSSHTCTLSPINTSQSSCKVTYNVPLPAGSRAITGKYSGDIVHARSSGSALLIIVD